MNYSSNKTFGDRAGRLCNKVSSDILHRHVNMFNCVYVYIHKIMHYYVIYYSAVCIYAHI